MKSIILSKLAIFALEKLAKRTDNKIDDTIVSLVKEASVVINPK